MNFGDVWVIIDVCVDFVDFVDKDDVVMGGFEKFFGCGLGIN